MLKLTVAVLLGVLVTVACKTEPKEKTSAVRGAHAAKAVSVATPAVPSWQKKYPNAKFIEAVDDDVVMIQDTDGSIYTVSTAPAVIDGATSVADMGLFEPELYTQMHEPIRASHDARNQCLAELRARGGKIDAQYNWTVGLRWVGDGKELRAVALVVPEHMWPSAFDGEARACWTRTVVGMTVASERVLDRVIEVPFCVYPVSKGN